MALPFFSGVPSCHCKEGGQNNCRFSGDAEEVLHLRVQLVGAVLQYAVPEHQAPHAHHPPHKLARQHQNPPRQGAGAGRSRGEGARTAAYSEFVSVTGEQWAHNPEQSDREADFFVRRECRESEAAAAAAGRCAESAAAATVTAGHG